MKVIIVKNLSKKFRIRNYHTLFEYLNHLFSTRTLYKKISVINNISFKIEKGKFVGVLGKNASGKTTLLKILAGISIPSGGACEIKLTTNSVIELGVGFNDELTARDNTYLYGVLLGLSREQINKKFKEIFEFADLRGFENVQLKKFSSGMKARLAFSIMRINDAKILLIDEIFAVGDVDFYKKCINYFSYFKKNGGTMLLASHDLEILKKFCDELIVINNGKATHYKSVTEGIKKYLESN